MPSRLAALFASAAVVLESTADDKAAAVVTLLSLADFP